MASLASWSVAGCRCASERAPDAQRSDAGIVAATCRRGALQLTLERSEASPGDTALADPSVELPFSPEPGVGLGIGAQLFATGLRHTHRGAVAVLSHFGLSSETARSYELGELHGDAAPPRLAADATDLIIGLQEANASGHDLRVARVPVAQLGTPLVWRAAPHQTRDESNVFDLAAQQGRVVVVWDEWFAGVRHGRVLAAAVPLDLDAPLPSSGLALSAPGVDAEAPRISARPGGYWVAWLVNEARGAETARVYDPVAEGRGSRGAYGERAIEVMPLDLSGVASGPALRVGTGYDDVVGYDLTTGPDGSAWLIWRKDAPSPGASGGQIVMAEIRADGAHDEAPLELEGVGAGEPSWLAAGDADGPWLTLPDHEDRTLLMRVRRPFTTSAPLFLSRDLNGAAAIGASAGKVLFAAARPTGIEFFSAQCDSPGERKKPPASEPLPSLAPDAAASEQQSQP